MSEDRHSSETWILVKYAYFSVNLPNSRLVMILNIFYNIIIDQILKNDKNIISTPSKSIRYSDFIEVLNMPTT
jgi:hypothetical protein